ncbi:MAG: hypothetical protein GEU88_11740 [Solirubrobacterales bacterium]|nr:hypothetical protein [Solirubrobacterales bacterium]
MAGLQHVHQPGLLACAARVMVIATGGFALDALVLDDDDVAAARLTVKVPGPGKVTLERRGR